MEEFSSKVETNPGKLSYHVTKAHETFLIHWNKILRTTPQFKKKKTFYVVSKSSAGKYVLEPAVASFGQSQGKKTFIIIFKYCLNSDK